MAGHNKWSKIKHKKGREDARRGKVFTRLGRELQVAAREGGPDPEYNAALRQAVDRAMAMNMPNDNIQRAIKRGAGLLPGQDIEEVIYEGYGPGGVAVIVNCLTDNRNRTVSEVRHAFSKAGGSMGENGSVAWMFDRIGIVTVLDDTRGEEDMMEAAIEAGADDVRRGEDADTWEFICGDTAVNSVRNGLKDIALNVTDFAIVYEAKTTMDIAGADAGQVMKFMELLDNLDDVQDVYANFDIPDEEFEKIAESA